MKRNFMSLSIETKLIISFFIAVSIPIFILFYVSTYLVTQHVDNMQTERIHAAQRNIINALDKEMNTLHVDNIDYSHWSDMYNATIKRDNAWLTDVFAILSSPQKGVDIVIIADANMDIIYQSNKIADFKKDAKKFIVRAAKGDEFVTFADIGGQVYYISFASIIDYGFTEKHAGILIMGKKFDKRVIDNLPASYNFDFDFIHQGTSLIGGTDSEEYKKYTEAIAGNKSYNNSKTAFYAITDYTYEPIMYLHIKEVGDFIGDTRAHYLKGFIIAIVVTYLLALIILYMIKNSIMKPVRKLRNKVRSLRGEGAIQIENDWNELTALTEEFEIMTNEVVSNANTLEEKNKELEYLVYKDDITNCYNKKYFRRYFREIIEEVERNNDTASLILVDIDYYKYYWEFAESYQIEDTLIKISQIINGVLMETQGRCELCYDGGDEFAAIMIGVDYINALETALEITRRVSEASFWGMERMPKGHLSVSCGMANFPKDTMDYDKLVKAARDRLERTINHNEGKVGYFYSIFNSLKDDIEESKKVVTYMSKAFLSVIDAMDQYTYTHTEGVVKYSSIIANELALSKEEIDNLKIGALLHDIGKLELGRELLNKKDKLTDEEFVLIKQHPTFGVNMLKTLTYFENAIDIVKYHHERFDGKGYPEGIKGKDIPLGARIVAVADSFDAMTTTRAYRTRHKSYEEAAEELIRCSGTQFDPDIVNAFLGYIDRNGFKFLLLE